MCCFTGKIDSVKNTRIFARMMEGGRQAVIYSMSLKTPQDVAMVLPIPVAKDGGEKAVKFVSLKDFPELFDRLHGCFAQSSNSAPRGYSAKSVQPVLEVVKVGAFDASYVPGIADFSRLDERFRLPSDVWSQIPAYKQFGFAVFKLAAGEAEVHPMAFTFPTALPGKLFFPALHIHDRKIHSHEQFDHTLYCQGAGLNPAEWEESWAQAGSSFKERKAMGLVDGDRHVFRRSVKGRHANQDITASIA